MLHPPSKKRLEESPISGKALAELLEDVSNNHDGEESIHYAVHYVEEGDEYNVGEYVPEIHIVLRRVLPSA